MRNLKRLTAILLLAVFCISFPAGAANATIKHDFHNMKDIAYTKTIESSHKVYRNYYIGEEQAYSICNTVSVYSVEGQQCTECPYNTIKETLLYTTHSLKDDPDHK